MSNGIFTYTPNDVTVVIAWGAYSHIASGFSESSIVSIDQNSPRFEMYTGADDTHTRTKKSDSSVTITLHLQNTSNSNDFLTALHNADVESSDSSGLFSITVKDNSGRTLHSCLEAYIAVMPNTVFSNGVEIREWQIYGAKCQNYIGGNARLDSADLSALEGMGVAVDARWQPTA